MIPTTDFERLFAPTTIAVIGASRDPNKWGSVVRVHTIEAGFRGRIYGVNPNAAGDALGGSEFVAGLDDIPGVIDCALIALPAARVAKVVRDCARRGVGFAILVATGFGETGAEGQAAERELVEISTAAGMRLVGPNSIGVYSGPAKMNMIHIPEVQPGSVGLATQSGNVAAELFELAKSAGVGFSRCIGLGNQADIGFGEVLGYFAEDPATTAVALYVEGISPRHASRFIEGLKACARQGKPVFVLKAGSSREGAAAAQTHSNSLAGDDVVWSAALAELGATRITSTEQAIDYLQCATKLPRIRGNVVVLADGGGTATLAVDAIREHGLNLAELSASSLQNLQPLIPPAAPKSPSLNPLTLDTPGGMEDDPRLLSRCVKVLALDPAVDLVVIAGGLGAYKSLPAAELETAEGLIEVFRNGLPIAIQSAFLGSGSMAVSRLFEAGIPLFSSIPRMAAAAATRVDVALGPSLSKASNSRPTNPGLAAVPPADSLEILRSYGIKVPRLSMVATRAQLSEAEALGFPLCLKVWDPNVVHKSDVKGVALDLRDPDAVQAAATNLWQRFPNAQLIAMPSFPRGLEIIVGCRTDPTFGPIVLFGRGGIWTELENDVVLLLAPASATTILDALRKLRMYPQLSGARGQDALAISALTQVVEAISHLAADRPDLDLEINPLILYRDGYEVADVRAERGTSRQVRSTSNGND